jgi:hypothetical protein
MENQNEKRDWEAMDVEEAGNVAEVMQGAVKQSPVDKGFNPDIVES